MSSDEPVERVLGPYRLGARIGAGGMGEVFRAVDPRLKRTVAIKLLNGRCRRSRAARQRFEREARAIAALTHPNICVVHDYDIDEAGGQPYLVMEYCSKARPCSTASSAGRCRWPRSSQSAQRSPMRSTRPTRSASSIATSSRRTCS